MKLSRTVEWFIYGKEMLSIGLKYRLSIMLCDITEEFDQWVNQGIPNDGNQLLSCEENIRFRNPQVR